MKDIKKGRKIPIVIILYTLTENTIWSLDSRKQLQEKDQKKSEVNFLDFRFWNSENKWKKILDYVLDAQSLQKNMKGIKKISE